MKLRRIARFHGLKKPRVRQTWNKYNLYNLFRLSDRSANRSRTFFQQKWAAKAATRAYHGEHIKERAWERMFSRRLLSAVDMDPAYLAANNGSEQASGRGSGRHQEPSQRRQKAPAITPYMQMIYAPMERRLDQAIFRALFASSARQARQFCVHGAVKVNGVKMQYPGYLLNPGDLFQVDTEKVMFATGRKKDPTAKLSKSASKPAAIEDAEAAEDAAETTTQKSDEPLDEAALKKKAARDLLRIRDRTKKVLANPTSLSAKRKQSLRALIKDVKLTYTRVTSPKSTATAANADEIINHLTQALSALEVTPTEAAQAAKTEEKETKDLAENKGLETKEERMILRRLIQEELENPTDPSKPYATPWAPRPYMSAFAFIPRYLEVNQNICAAVYLRHPVARQGLAEVPTPFGAETNQLTFNWYLRRG